MRFSFQNWTMRQKLLVGGIGAGVIGMIILAIFVYSYVSRIILEQNYKSMDQIVEENDRLLTQWLEDQVDKAEMLALKNTFRDACYGKNLNKAKADIEQLFKKSQGLENMFLAYPDGQIFLLAVGDAQQLKIDISKIDLYSNNASKARQGEVWISNAGKSPATGKPVSLITAPIIDNNEVIGIVGTPVELTYFSDKFITNQKIGTTGYTFIFDPNGIALAYPDKDQILKLNLNDYDFGKEWLRIKSGRHHYTYQGKKTVAVLRTNQMTQWLLGARVEEAEFLSDTRKLLSIMILFTIVIGAGVGLILYFTTNSIIKVIQTITHRLQDIAQGEGDLTRRIDYNKHDEMGELVKWFNLFVEKIQKLMQTVTSVANQVKVASNEISTASEELASGSEEQQSQLSEIATSIEEMSAMILETSRNTNETQNNAQQADKAALEGSNTVAETISGIDNVVQITQSAVHQIAKLEERSREIGEVIQVIDDIADQTNLLALNANIEAARAGEAGRGFAVVADEVRKLAERTVRATAEIGEKIKQIQTEVTSSVEAMNQVANISGDSQKIAAKARTALDNIRNLVSNVTQAVTQIATATDQQSSGAEEISKNIESVSSVAKQAAARAQELASSAEELDHEIKNLKDLIGQFKV
jgi:methyl-accepting chemotaxis protein